MICSQCQMPVNSTDSFCGECGAPINVNGAVPNAPKPITIPILGGQMSARPLHFFWIVDCSGSMAADGKIEALNNAIHEAIPHMRTVADDNPNAQVFVRVLKFSSGAEWHVAQPTPIEDFRWSDLSAFGVTDLGKGLKMIADELDVKRMPSRAFPPVLALISDGDPTDDFAGGLAQLMAQPWGKKAVRIAIAIGAQTPEATDCLQRFIGHSELKPFHASNPEMLARHIRFVSTVVTQAASSPPSAVKGIGVAGPNFVLPNPPKTDDAISSASITW